MASEWRSTTLGEFIRLQRGHDLTAEERIPGSFPVMGSAGQNGTHGKFIARGPGVVIGRSGASMGRVHYVPSHYWPHNTCLYVTDFLGNDPRFTFYLLSTLDLASYNSGSAQPSLNRNFVYTKPITVPPPKEQRAIAHVLGTLDDKIELNRKQNETLEAMARALFKAWFVDFEPVRAKMEGRWQRGLSLPGLPAHLYDLFPDRLVESELGEIPEGWQLGTIEDLCSSISSGGTPTRKNPRYWSNGTIPWFKTGELDDGPLIDAEEKINETALAESSCKLWPAGTILFALYASPTVGRIGILTAPGTSNQAAAGLMAKTSIGTPFLRRVLIEAREKLQRVAVGAAQQNINQAILKSHKIVLPASGLAEEYSRIVNPWDEKQVEMARGMRSLSLLRDTLLPKLISGELRIADAEAFLKGRG